MQILSISKTEKLKFLRKNQYFSKLKSSYIDQLEKGTNLYHYDSGEVICWQDEECLGLFTIQRGNLKLFKISPKGRELIIRVLGEGTSFNEVPVFDHGLNPVNVAALEPSEVWLISSQVIRHLVTENPDISQAVILSLASNLRMLVNLVEELSFQQVTNRLARLISQLPPEQLQGATNQRVTQDQMAARLGTVREVVARSLRELERSGAIKVRYRQILVVNPQVLQAWVGEPHLN